MSEIYTNSPEAQRKVYLDVPITPIDGTLDVVIYENGVSKYTVNTVVLDNNKYYFYMPFFLTQTDRELDIHWRFNYSENNTTYEYDAYTQVDVVTPILPLDDIRNIVDDVDATDEQIAEVESAVRYIIQAHTGQFFGRFVGVKSITGSGESDLRLPARLMTLNSINGNTFWNQDLSIRGGGWYLRSRVYGVPTIRSDFDGWHENPYTSPAPITAPGWNNLHVFVENLEYAIDGVWGWTSVPTPVKQAAMLLVKDYWSGESIYRDRYITATSAADWQLEFNDGAFSNTGNARANQLLAEFVLRRGWMVI